MRRRAGQRERERESNRSRKKGFTLIELLVVISIIGFLATLAITSFNIARVKAKATKIIADLKIIEKSLYLLMDEENTNSWWREGEKSTNLNNFSGLSSFVKIPVPPISGFYAYDNDGDTLIEGCGCCKGVNLGVSSCGSDCITYFNSIDDIVDGGDGRSYGKVRTDSSYSSIYYNISPHEDIY